MAQNTYNTSIRLPKAAFSEVQIKQQNITKELYSVHCVHVPFIFTLYHLQLMTNFKATQVLSGNFFFLESFPWKNKLEVFEKIPSEKF